MSAPVSLQTRLIKNAMLSSMLAGLLAWLLLLGVSSYQAIQLHESDRPKVIRSMKSASNSIFNMRYCSIRIF